MPKLTRVEIVGGLFELRNGEVPPSGLKEGGLVIGSRGGVRHGDTRVPVAPPPPRPLPEPDGGEAREAPHGLVLPQPKEAVPQREAASNHLGLRVGSAGLGGRFRVQTPQTVVEDTPGRAFREDLAGLLLQVETPQIYGSDEEH